MKARNNLAAQMLAAAIHSIDRYGSSCIDNAQPRLEFRIGTNHRNPAIHAESPHVSINIGDAERLAFDMYEVDVGIAMNADDTRYSGGDAATGNIARIYTIDLSG